MLQKKQTFYTLCFIGLLLCSILPILAVKSVAVIPDITVLVKNPPEEYYVDILTPENHFAYVSDQEIHLEAIDVFFTDAVQQAFNSLNEEGWYPENIQQKQIGYGLCGLFIVSDFQGVADKDGVMRHSFTKFGWYDQFRVALVTADGKLKVSEVIDSKYGYREVSFDYATGETTVLPEKVAYMLKLAIVYLEILLIEGACLILFGLVNRKNIRLLFGVNLLTTIIAAGIIMMKNSLLVSEIALMSNSINAIPDILWLIKCFIFCKWMAHPSLIRKISYTCTANLVSFMVCYLYMKRICYFWFSFL